MSATILLVAAVTLAYAVTSILFALKGSPLWIVYFGYAVANIGLILVDAWGS
jgi:hypothetical protein